MQSASCPMKTAQSFRRCYSSLPKWESLDKALLKYHPGTLFISLQTYRHKNHPHLLHSENFPQSELWRADNYVKITDCQVQSVISVKCEDQRHYSPNWCLSESILSIILCKLCMDNCVSCVRTALTSSLLQGATPTSSFLFIYLFLSQGAIFTFK